MISQHFTETAPLYWGRRAHHTKQTNPFDPETREHREFVQGRMLERERLAAMELVEAANV